MPKKINVAALKRDFDAMTYDQLREKYGIANTTIAKIAQSDKRIYVIPDRPQRKKKRKSTRKKRKARATAKPDNGVIKNYEAPAPKATSFIRQEVGIEFAERWRAATSGLSMEERAELFERIGSQVILELQYPDLAAERRDCTRLGKQKKLGILEAIEA